MQILKNVLILWVSHSAGHHLWQVGQSDWNVLRSKKQARLTFHCCYKLYEACMTSWYNQNLESSFQILNLVSFMTLSRIRSLEPIQSRIRTLIPILSRIRTLVPILSRIRALVPVLSKIRTLVPILSRIRTLVPILSRITSLVPILSRIRSLLPILSRIR